VRGHVSQMVSGVSRGMGVLDGGGNRRRGTGSFGVNLGRPIVTNHTLRGFLHRPTNTTHSRNVAQLMR